MSKESIASKVQFALLLGGFVLLFSTLYLMIREGESLQSVDLTVGQSLTRVLAEQQLSLSVSTDSIKMASPETGEFLSDMKLEGESIEGPAGTIQRVSLPLDAVNLFRYDLLGKDFAGVAFRWQKGNIYYALSSNSDLPQLAAVPISDEHSGDEEFLTSELIFPAEGDRYLFVQQEDESQNAQFDLITPSEDTSGGLLGVYNQNSGAKYTTLPIISRDSWGAPLAPPDIDDPARQTWEPAYYHVNRIVIHHTVTPNSPADPAYYVRTVYLFHAVTKGWGDVGYNFLIDHLGNIYEGKLGGDEVKGYHAGATANRGSVGIALLGDFTSISPTQAAKDSLVKLMAEKAAFYNFNLEYSPRDLTNFLNPGYTVFGHRDVYNRIDDGGWLWMPEYTACPGNQFHTELAGVTAQAQAYKNANFAEIKAAVTNAEAIIEGGTSDNALFIHIAEGYTLSQVLPSFSGIVGTSESKSSNGVILFLPDWDNEGAYPPLGWEGWEDIQTYFPASDGFTDRARTLIKIFLLDPRVDKVWLGNSEGSLHLI